MSYKTSIIIHCIITHIKHCIIIKYSCNNSYKTSYKTLWHHGVVVITTAQLPSTKSELRFCAGSIPARGLSNICNGENLWQ